MSNAHSLAVSPLLPALRELWAGVRVPSMFGWTVQLTRFALEKTILQRDKDVRRILAASSPEMLDRVLRRARWKWRLQLAGFIGVAAPTAMLSKRKEQSSRDVIAGMNSAYETIRVDLADVVDADLLAAAGFLDSAVYSYVWAMSSIIREEVDYSKLPISKLPTPVEMADIAQREIMLFAAAISGVTKAIPFHSAEMLEHIASRVNDSAMILVDAVGAARPSQASEPPA